MRSGLLTRRSVLGAGGILAAAVFGGFGHALEPTREQRRMNARKIPSSGEALPVIGLGTYRGFDVSSGTSAHASLPGVLDALFDAGGSLIDSSPMYGKAEQVTGDLLAARNLRSRAFLATKVWTQGRAAGIAQMEQSFKLLRTDHIELMQIHNLVDWKVHLPSLRAMRDEKRIRYIGITHYSQSAYGAVETVLKAEQFDFLQINYSLDDRAAAERLLPLAKDRGVAVIINVPFGGGSLLRRLRGKPLPAWASEVGAVSWAQLALKFVLANTAVTCVIPGTGNPKYMAENAAAAGGPDLTQDQLRMLIAIADQ